MVPRALRLAARWEETSHGSFLSLPTHPDQTVRPRVIIYSALPHRRRDESSGSQRLWGM